MTGFFTRLKGKACDFYKSLNGLLKKYFGLFSVDWSGIHKLPALFPLMLAIWAVALGLVVATTVQFYQLSAMKAGIESANTQISTTPYIDFYTVPATEIEAYIEMIESAYSGLDITVTRNGLVHVKSKDTSGYRAFRQFSDHLQYGGALWRVEIQKLCLGRECSPNQIEAIFRVVDVRVSR